MRIALGSLGFAALAYGATAGSAAQPSSHACIAPEVKGVTLAMARDVLRRSGCAVAIRQLPAHEGFLSPADPDDRQLVADQSPAAGAHTSTVTISLAPLCAQPAAPGPGSDGSSVTSGPTELVVGVYLEGGPLTLAAHCHSGQPLAGTVTVLTAQGHQLASRSIRAGHLGVFPLAPGKYRIKGALEGRSLGPISVTLKAHQTVRRSLVEDVP